MPIVHFNNGIKRVIIGTLDPEKKEFSKKVQTSKHLYRVKDSWAIDAKYFTDVLLPNDYTIKVTDVEEKVRYTTTAKEMSKHGEFFHFKSAGRDYGAQIGLARRYWKKEPYGTAR